MALKAPKGSTGGSQFLTEVVEPDTYPARVVQVIDMGLQPQPAYKGEEKEPRHTISITYEMVDLFMKDKDGNELPDKPRWFSERFPLYPLSSDRAKSTQRYMAIDPKNKFEGDFSQLVGAPCSVLLGQYKNNKGNMANGINAVSPIMRGMKLPELQGTPAVFLMDEPDMEVFEKFPDWLKDTLKANLEFKGSALEAALNGEKPEPKEEKPAKKAPAKEPEPQEDPEEDDNDSPW
jgi:hypothetical protein